MRSIGNELDKYRGLAPGFDFLRVGLALGVVAWHAPAITSGRDALDEMPLTWFAGYGILVMFFGLSGFLIAGSALRLTLRDFLVNRGLRIFPALTVEILLSAFILGPLVSALGAAAYFGQAQTWHYLTNAVGLINYRLPGVFTTHPTDYVNASLWTVPHEIGCYAIMSALMVTGLLKRPALVIAAALALMAFTFVVYGLHMDTDHQTIVHKAIFWTLIHRQAAKLYIGFLLGIAAYLYRYRLPYDNRIAGACALICLALALTGIGPIPRASDPILYTVGSPCLVYLTAWLGATRLPSLPIYNRGDYSYGIYLYGWPMQQITLTMFPGVSSSLVQFCLVVPLLTLWAAFSWHVIEKPILALRKKFSFVARVRLQPGPEDIPHAVEVERLGQTPAA